MKRTPAGRGGDQTLSSTNEEKQVRLMLMLPATPKITTCRELLRTNQHFHFPPPNILATPGRNVSFSGGISRSGSLL